MDPTQLQNMMLLQQLSQGMGQTQGQMGQGELGQTMFGPQAASMGNSPNMYSAMATPPPTGAPPMMPPPASPY